MAKPTNTPQSKKQRITEKQYLSLQEQMNAFLETSDLPQAGTEIEGPVLPTDMTKLVGIQEAMDKEGVTPTFLVKWFKQLFTATVPKWNRNTGKWDYFVDLELVRRLLDMGFKLQGGYEQRSVNINVNVDLETIIRDPKSPESLSSRRLRSDDTAASRCRFTDHQHF
jgi:hypothetical protein